MKTPLLWEPRKLDSDLSVGTNTVSVVLLHCGFLSCKMDAVILLHGKWSLTLSFFLILQIFVG